MNKHRVRMTELSGDPIPVLWVEIEKDSWLQLNIDLAEDMNLHDEIHVFLRAMKQQRTLPLTYTTRAFNIYPDLMDYQESFIE